MCASPQYASRVRSEVFRAKSSYICNVRLLASQRNRKFPDRDTGKFHNVLNVER